MKNALKEVEKKINERKKLLNKQLNKEFHNRTMGNFDNNFTYNESKEIIQIIKKTFNSIKKKIMILYSI